MDKKRKHSFAKKLKAVQEYLNQEKSMSWLSRRYKVNRSQIQEWLRKYQVQGAQGLKKQPKWRYSDQFKLRAVQLLLSQSMSLAQASAYLGASISPITLLQWKRAYEKGQLKPNPEESLIMSKGRKPYRPLNKPDQEKTKEELIRELQFMRAGLALEKKLNELRVPPIIKKTIVEK